MGWGKDLILGDLQTNPSEQIKRLKHDLESSEDRDIDQDKQILRLTKENNELKLYLSSLIKLLISRGNITEAEIRRVVEAVDATDGQIDGKFNGEIV